MWIAKLKGFDEGNIYSTKAKKHNVSIHYYPINHYLERNKYYFIAIGLLEGTEENINSFFKDLKREKKPSRNKRYVIRLEKNGNFFICVTAQTKSVELKRFVHLYYNPKFIHISPAFIDRNGWEWWHIASLERKDIEKLIKVSEEKYRAKILSLKKGKVKNVGILSILPELTEKQKTAFLLAVKNGYYEYPRGIKLEKLAKIMKLSLSTYQAHLRKAERQLLPFIAIKYF